MKFGSIFDSNRPNLNKKTEFIAFCRKIMDSLTRYFKLRINNHLIDLTSNVYCLGIYLDQNLRYELEVEHLLNKMACGIKTIYLKICFLKNIPNTSKPIGHQSLTPLGTITKWDLSKSNNRPQKSIKLG